MRVYLERFAVDSFYMHANVHVCVLQGSLSGCWNMNVWCNFPAVPNPGLPLLRHNELRRGNSEGSCVIREPFLMPPLVNASRPVPTDRRTLQTKLIILVKYTHKLEPVKLDDGWSCIVLTSISSVHQSSAVHKTFLCCFVNFSSSPVLTIG